MCVVCLFWVVLVLVTRQSVGGRLGQTDEGGLYSPVSMNPTLVEKNALLLSGMSGLSVSPNGTCWQLSVADDGTLTTTAL